MSELECSNGSKTARCVQGGCCWGAGVKKSDFDLRFNYFSSIPLQNEICYSHGPPKWFLIIKTRGYKHAFERQPVLGFLQRRKYWINHNLFKCQSILFKLWGHTNVPYAQRDAWFIRFEVVLQGTGSPFNMGVCRAISSLPPGGIEWALDRFDSAFQGLSNAPMFVQIRAEGPVLDQHVCGEVGLWIPIYLVQMRQN